LFLNNPDAATAEAFDRAIKSGSIMRDAVCPVLDGNGNPLVVGAIYRYQRSHTSSKIKIREWTFGSGNMLDRYYWVFYTDDQLNDSFWLSMLDTLTVFLVGLFIRRNLCL
jgi:hypothetical protein